MNEATLGFLTSEEPRTCDLLACRQHEGRPTENPALKAGTRHYTEKCSVREPSFCVLVLDLKKIFRPCQAVDRPPRAAGDLSAAFPTPFPSGTLSSRTRVPGKQMLTGDESKVVHSQPGRRVLPMRTCSDEPARTDMCTRAITRRSACQSLHGSRYRPHRRRRARALPRSAADRSC